MVSLTFDEDPLKDSIPQGGKKIVKGIIVVEGYAREIIGRGSGITGLKWLLNDQLDSTSMTADGALVQR